MITRIELKNFMSHSHTVIEPAAGLTVLVGDNNTGKSAVINALQVLCSNLSGDYMVRHGAKECLVRVETGEGHELEWRRKGKVVSYRINGRDVHRLGGAVPEDLHDLLRLPRVEAENETFDIHFGEQKNPIFLLNTSPGKRAAFFASSSDTIKLIEMQSLHKKKVQDAKWREARLIKEEARYSSRLEKLSPVDELDGRLTELEAAYQALNDRLAAINGLRGLIGDLAEGERRVRRWQESVRVIEDLPGPPELQDSPALSGLIGRLEKVGRDVRARQEENGVLAGLSDPPELADTPGLREVIARLEKYDAAVSREETYCGLLDRCPQPPAMNDLIPLKNLLAEMAGAEKEIQTQENVERCLAGLGPPPELRDVEVFRDNLVKLEKAGNNWWKQEAELKRTKEALNRAAAELREFVDRTGICPTCGQEMDFERLLTRAAACKRGEA